MKHYRLLWIIVGIFCSGGLWGQQDRVVLKRVSLQTQQDKVFKTRYAQLDDHILKFNAKGQRYNLDLSEIKYIKYKNGSYLLRGFYIGLGLGVLNFAIAAPAEAVSNYLLGTKVDKAVPNSLMLVGLGTLVGSLFPKYKLVYDPQNNFFDKSDILIGYNEYGLGLHYMF